MLKIARMFIFFKKQNKIKKQKRNKAKKKIKRGGIKNF